jgi:(E)-4-hydroxy-3-methylbut-2-enyl-diphosphate synthase
LNDIKSTSGKYCEDVTRTVRRESSTITVGVHKIGSSVPVVKQTMCTTNTADIESSVAQCKKVHDHGASLARLTVQGNREAKACQGIRDALDAQNCDVALVADIHFTPKVALKVAESFDKIRVNPGNFADGFKKFDEKVYETREEYDAALPFIEELFVPLVQKCKENGKAMRIGTNHGSLSSRVMSFWGDSPRGMVESAIEFANICRKYDFHNFLFSMKASNPLVMVQAYRLLAAELYKLGWDYPLHLGVTEAGEGEDGRMKSAIGIGSLLVDGLGDTVRVSLTEDPEYELEPCAKLIEIGEELLKDTSKFEGIPAWEETSECRDYLNFKRRRGYLPKQLDGDDIDIRGMMNRDGSVFLSVRIDELRKPDSLYAAIGAKTVVGLPFKDIACADTIFLRETPSATDNEARRTLKRLQDVAVGIMAPIDALKSNPVPNSVALVSLDTIIANGGIIPTLPSGAVRYAIQISGIESEESYKVLPVLSQSNLMTTIVLETPKSVSRVHASRRAFQMLHNVGCNAAVIHSLPLEPDSKDELILRAGSEAGALLVDGLGDGIMLDAINDQNRNDFSLELLRSTSFSLLQGTRMRSTKTDFVSCPSCGRTLFDLQEVTEQIKERTGHLPGVAIAIMGCIVNGPGEMADADFGYVGGAPGKVDLYVGKEVVKRGIPNPEACDALVDLIKEYGRWVEKDTDVKEEVNV